MGYSITKSVGIKSRSSNLPTDVLTIQKLINQLIRLKKIDIRTLSEDKLIGRNTVTAIKHAQATLVGMRLPDGVIDPNGRTLNLLNSLVKTNKPKGKLQVKYRKNAKPILTSYTLDIIKTCMAMSDVDKVDISSTLRSIEDQARIMFRDNLNAYNKGISVREHRGYNYASAGRSVDSVFTSYYPSHSEEEVRSKMEQEIRKWLDKGIRTSKHCVTRQSYSNNNIFDIPYSSVPHKERAKFESALILHSKSVNARKYSTNHSTPSKVTEKPIDKIIVEKRCWHIEIPQANKVKVNTTNS